MLLPPFKILVCVGTINAPKQDVMYINAIAFVKINY